MPGTNPTAIPISGGVNTAADPATAATVLAANVSLGPAGENAPRAPLTNFNMTGLGTSPVIGLYVWKDQWLIMVTADRKVWAAAVGAPTAAIALSSASAATQLPGALRPTFTEDSLRVIIAGGGFPLAWTGAGLCSQLVTVGSAPAATHVASLGQRIIANNLPTVSVWSWSWIGDGNHDHWGAEPTTSSIEVADANPDGVVAIYATVREAYAFGQKTVQVYSVSGDTVQGIIFPFASVVTLEVGCSAPYTPILADGPLIWLDDKRRIIISDGRTFQDISTDISVTLRAMSTVSDAWSYREDIGNQTNYVFQFPTEGVELVYDIDKKAWLQRSLYTVNGQTIMPYQCKAYWPALNVHLFGSSTTGAIYRWTEGAGQDLGVPVVMERQTGWLDHGTRGRKRSVRVRSVFRRGAGGTGVPDVFEVRVADDGGPWGDWEQVSIGASGDNEQVEDLYMGGVFRRRRYHFRYTGSNSTAWLSSEEHWQECAS
jgi:hypothetical protein